MASIMQFWKCSHSAIHANCDVTIHSILHFWNGINFAIRKFKQFSILAIMQCWNSSNSQFSPVCNSEIVAIMQLCNSAFHANCNVSMQSILQFWNGIDRAIPIFNATSRQSSSRRSGEPAIRQCGETESRRFCYSELKTIPNSNNSSNS